MSNAYVIDLTAKLNATVVAQKEAAAKAMTSALANEPRYVVDTLGYTNKKGKEISSHWVGILRDKASWLTPAEEAGLLAIFSAKALPTKGGLYEDRTDLRRYGFKVEGHVSRTWYWLAAEEWMSLADATTLVASVLGGTTKVQPAKAGGKADEIRVVSKTQQAAPGTKVPEVKPAPVAGKKFLVSLG